MKSVLVCIVKDEDHYIEEWIDYNLKLGFDEIIMYVNDWVCQVDRPNLKKIVFNGHHKQMESYSHFIEFFSKDYDWAAFFDCDEFLVLKKHNSINEFIKEYDNQFGIGINWVYFGSKGKVKRDDEKSVLKCFKFRQKEPDKHVKTILNLKSKGRMVLPHNPNTPLMDTNGNFFSGPFNENGPIDVVQINHYHHRTFEDWLIRCKRGQSDHSPTKKPEQWLQNKDRFVDIEDLLAYNFMYKN